MNFNNRTIKLKARTWVRDSYGLYDHETRNYNECNIDINSNGKLIKHELTNQILFVDSQGIGTHDMLYTQQPHDVLAEIKAKNGQFFILPDTSMRSDAAKLWQVIPRSSDDGRHALNVGDMIKFGRIIFKVNQIKLEEKEPNETVTYYNSIYESIKGHMKKNVESSASLTAPNTVTSTMIESFKRSTKHECYQANPICRICLGEHNDDIDPLITPCKCSGSLEYVHIKCLQEWMKNRLNLQEKKNMVTTITWKNLNCELCKTLLPYSIHHGNEEYCIIGSKKKYNTYIALEVFAKDKKPIGMYILDMKNPNYKFTLGRAHNCDIKIQDISVSREHAYISQDKGKIYLSDNGSKFGTLVSCENPLQLNDGQDIYIQNGRILLKFFLRRPWLSMIPCIGSLFCINSTNPNTNNEERVIEDKKYKLHESSEIQISEKMDQQIEKKDDDLINSNKEQYLNTDSGKDIDKFNIINSLENRIILDQYRGSS